MEKPEADRVLAHEVLLNTHSRLLDDIDRRLRSIEVKLWVIIAVLGTLSALVLSGRLTPLLSLLHG